MQFITSGDRIAVENFTIGDLYTITFVGGTYINTACIGKGADFVTFQRNLPELLFSLTMETAELVSSIDLYAGGTGTNNYNDLTNKPQINDVELVGNKSLSDLGIQATISDIDTIRSGAAAGATAVQPAALADYQPIISDLDTIRSGAAAGATAVQPAALADYQPIIDSSHKLDADLVDDTTSTNKFATAAQLSQIGINENNISTEQAKTVGMTAGGSDYITVNGIRIYVTATAPTGARTGDLWIGGSSIKKKSENLFDKDTADMQYIYIYTDDTFVHENQNTISVVFPCQPNTTYTISKTISSRFAIGYTNTYPQNGTTAYSINADNTATTLSITTGSNAEYIVILIVYTPQETKTTQEILDSIMINDWT